MIGVLHFVRQNRAVKVLEEMRREKEIKDI